MTKQNRLVSVLAIALTAITLSSSHAEDSVRHLFNGTSLEGWETEDGHPVTAGWAVEDGMLVRTARSGAIYAGGEFGDFDLRFEWKIARGGNSGIKYRVAFYEKGVHGSPNWLGCEYQLFDDHGRRTVPNQSTGALYDLYAPSKHKKLNPIDDFNISRIVVQGTNIEHWLNGDVILAVDTTSDEWKQRIACSKFAPVKGFFKNSQGRIQLQDHGHNIWFRSITIRDID